MREAHRSDIVRLMRKEIVLIGPVGVGKTTVALLLTVFVKGKTPEQVSDEILNILDT